MQNFVDLPTQKMVWSHLVVLEFPSDHSECVVDEVVVDVHLQVQHMSVWNNRTGNKWLL